MGNITAASQVRALLGLLQLAGDFLRQSWMTNVKLTMIWLLGTTFSTPKQRLTRSAELMFSLVLTSLC
ncbi:hypothetical protein SD10_16145 [Spirosoma radiotolerans]|uniref:Uncharacterized protein n=1 Tax=Spirosoma radiotolerans TaxID=1379870 RepID=A0A0E3ZXF9_9BACT|nr:hypothetical protein SD10_16145 [Spirosoma radiotolerans]